MHFLCQKHSFAASAIQLKYINLSEAQKRWKKKGAQKFLDNYNDMLDRMLDLFMILEKGYKKLRKKSFIFISSS